MYDTQPILHEYNYTCTTLTDKDMYDAYDGGVFIVTGLGI